MTNQVKYTNIFLHTVYSIVNEKKNYYVDKDGSHDASRENIIIFRDNLHLYRLATTIVVMSWASNEKAWSQLYKQPKLVLTGPDEMKATDYVDETEVFLLFSIK